MAKWANDTLMDAFLNVIKNNCTRMTVCAGQPTTYTEGNATNALADVTMASTDFTGPADGDSTGRKLTVASKADVLIDTGGTADHVALLDVTGTALLLVTTCTPQALVSGSTVTFPSWKITVADPT